MSYQNTKEGQRAALRVTIEFRLSFLFLFLMSWGCKKFVEVDTAKTELLESAVFENSQSAISAMAGVYSKIIAATTNMLSGGTSLFAGLASDEIMNTTANSTYDPFLKNSLLSNNTSINTKFWNHSYPIIYQCNAIVEGLQRSNTIADSLKKELTAEALLVRAFFYFNLVNLFGDIPLVLSTDYRVNARMPRTAAASVYDQIIADLTQASNELPSIITNSNGRPNKWSAKALLARVYLFTKNYEKAEKEATDVITCGLFELVANLNNVFLVNSKEIIWQIMPVGTAQINSPEGNIFIPSSATTRPPFALTPSLLSKFISTDQRKVNWTKSVTVSAQNYTYPFKFKIRTAATVTEANVLLRLAEQYLIRAEARLYQDKLIGVNSAQSDLNAVRNRAGTGNTAAVSRSDLENAIVDERALEFFVEWGHRWYDLKRWNKANSVLSVIKSPNWSETDQLWPVPISEINLNTALIQNPSY